MDIVINIPCYDGLKNIGVNMKAVVVIGKNYQLNKADFEHCLVIGVDRGALFCQKNGIIMDVAIGDFDSITQEQLDRIQATRVIKLNPIKDETDTKEAIELCRDYEEVTILGGIGGKRIEHFYANLMLLEEYPNVKIKDDDSFIFTTDKSITLKKNIYKFVSIFSLCDNTSITLKGFKYPLNSYHMKRLDSIGISNEIVDGSAEIHLEQGRIMIILSKDDSL